MIWDACKCEYAIQYRPSSEWKGSAVDAHAGTCHPSVWEIRVLTIGSAHAHILNIR